MQVASELSPVLCPQPLTHWSLVLGQSWVFSLQTFTEDGTVLRAPPRTQLCTMSQLPALLPCNSWCKRESGVGWLKLCGILMHL